MNTETSKPANRRFTFLIGPGPAYFIPRANKKKAMKMDFPHFDIITEHVDSPVER